MCCYCHWTDDQTFSLLNRKKTISNRFEDEDKVRIPCYASKRNGFFSKLCGKKAPKNPAKAKNVSPNLVNSFYSSNLGEHRVSIICESNSSVDANLFRDHIYNDITNSHGFPLNYKGKDVYGMENDSKNVIRKTDSPNVDKDDGYLTMTAKQLNPHYQNENMPAGRESKSIAISGAEKKSLKNRANGVKPRAVLPPNALNVDPQQEKVRAQPSLLDARAEKIIKNHNNVLVNNVDLDRNEDRTAEDSRRLKKDSMKKVKKIPSAAKLKKFPQLYKASAELDSIAEAQYEESLKKV